MPVQSAFLEIKNIRPSLGKIVNVASVPQRSPFRYPGGKTWLIPTVRRWLTQDKEAAHLIEPFAGGGIVSLTAAFENLARRITMIELDEEIAAVWEVALNGKNKWLANKITNFNLTIDNIRTELKKNTNKFKTSPFAPFLKTGFLMVELSPKVQV